MSKNDKKASEKERDEQKKDSVYDFLYCDTRRINSFLAQFDDAGHLEKIINREGVSKGGRRGWKVSLGGGALVAGTGGSATAGYEVSPDSHGTESSERVYDPLWTNSLTFLDYLDEANLIQRAIENGRIGQFVLAKGSLTVMDLTLFKGMWQIPAIKKMIAAGAQVESQNGDAQSRQQRRALQRGGNQQSAVSQYESTLDAGMSLIGLLPHAIQARMTIQETQRSVWTSLKEDALVVSATDLTLKHGTTVAGKWNMLGILDALPDIDGEELTESGKESALRSLALVNNPFGAMMNEMMPLLRPILGRPFPSYGMTPLMIFREIDA